MVADSTQPPSDCGNGGTSVPPPAKEIRNGARARRWRESAAGPLLEVTLIFSPDVDRGYVSAASKARSGRCGGRSCSPPAWGDLPPIEVGLTRPGTGRAAGRGHSLPGLAGSHRPVGGKLDGPARTRREP